MLRYEYIYQGDVGHLLWFDSFTFEYGYLGKILLEELSNVIALSTEKNMPYELTYTPAVLKEIKVRKHQYAF